MALTDKYLNHCISSTATAREALKMLNQLPDNDIRVLFVIEDKRVVGTLTDGDIRRGLLADREISELVDLYMNRNFRKLKKEDVRPEILQQYKEADIWFLPVIDENGEIDDVVNLREVKTVIPAAALIMAGGRGERLRPLTDSLPKPMLKIGNTPIIELNIDRLAAFGIKKFYISIRYLGEKIIEHLGDGSSKGIEIEYIHEEEPLGTIGACSLVNNAQYEQLLVMNSDILTNLDFEDFFNYFQSKNAMMCAASVPYNVNIPYGIMNTGNEDAVTGLVEKPTYTYYANAGIYFVKSELIKRIPKNASYNATDLMQELIGRSEKLVHYPILQYWLDIGKYEDYIKAQQDYKYISF